MVNEKQKTESIEERLRKMTNDITAIQSKISMIFDDIKSLLRKTAGIDSISNKLTTIVEEINDINNRIGE